MGTGRREIEASTLTAEHLRDRPVWEWAPERPGVDTNIRPAREQVRITDLAGICAAHLTFANGGACLGAAAVYPPKKRVSSLMVPIAGGKLFSLAPVHAPPFTQKDFGPDALCRALGLEKTAVFPIRYRLAVPFEGDAQPLEGTYEEGFRAKFPWE